MTGINRSGIDSKNKESCLCGGEEPTYCCYPEEDKENCYCPDGSFKNLCGDCDEEDETESVDLILPRVARIIDRTGRDRCGLALDWEDNYTTSEISYTIECFSGTFSSNWEPLSQKAPKDYNLGRRILSIELPKNEICNLIIYQKFPCNVCCELEKKNRQRIMTTRIDNFDYKYYRGLDLLSKLKYLKLDYQIEATPDDSTFYTGDPNCYCTNCED